MQNRTFLYHEIQDTFVLASTYTELTSTTAKRAVTTLFTTRTRRNTSEYSLQHVEQAVQVNITEEFQINFTETSTQLYYLSIESYLLELFTSD